MAAKTQDAAGEAGEKYLRAALTPIVNDAMKRAQVRAQMPGLPDSRPFVDAIVRLFEQTPLAAPRVQDDSLRAAAQGMWDAFKDFERYPRTVDGDRINALAVLRAALDKPPAAPTGETDSQILDRLLVRCTFYFNGVRVRTHEELTAALNSYADGAPTPEAHVLAARVPAPSAPQEPRGEPWSKNGHQWVGALGRGLYCSRCDADFAPPGWDKCPVAEQEAAALHTGERDAD